MEALLIRPHQVRQPRCCDRKAREDMKQMTARPKNALRRIAGTDDLRILPFSEGGRTYGTRPGFGPSSSTCTVRTCVQWPRFYLVPGRNASEDGPDYRRGKGGGV